MIKIIPKEKETTTLDKISYNTPIFVKHSGKLIGMVVQETDPCHAYEWIVKTGGDKGAYGHYPSRESLIEAGRIYGYEFYIQGE